MYFPTRQTDNKLAKSAHMNGHYLDDLRFSLQIFKILQHFFIFMFGWVNVRVLLSINVTPIENINTVQAVNVKRIWSYVIIKCYHIIKWESIRVPLIILHDSNSNTNSYILRDSSIIVHHSWYSSAEVLLLQVALPWFDKLEVLAVRVHLVKHPHISIAAIVRMHKVPLRVIALKSKVIAYPGRDQPKHVAVMFGWRHAKVALTTSVATNVVSRLLGGVKAKSLSEWTSRFLRSEQKDSLLLERENRV